MTLPEYIQTKIHSPVELEKFIFNKRDVYTEEQIKTIRKHGWEVHPEWKKPETQNPWITAQNNIVAPNRSEELVDVTKAFNPFLKAIQKRIGREENERISFIFEMLMDMKVHTIEEIQSAMDLKGWTDERDIRKKVSIIRGYLQPHYEIPRNPGGSDAVYYIKNKEK